MVGPGSSEAKLKHLFAAFVGDTALQGAKDCVSLSHGQTVWLLSLQAFPPKLPESVGLSRKGVSLGSGCSGAWVVLKVLIVCCLDNGAQSERWTDGCRAGACSLFCGERNVTDSKHGRVYGWASQGQAGCPALRSGLPGEMNLISPFSAVGGLGWPQPVSCEPRWE